MNAPSSMTDLVPIAPDGEAHTKCVVINARLITPVCPLSPGSCTWRHRKTGHCKYSSAFDSNPPSASTIAELVGEPPPSPATVQRITEAIKSKFKEVSNL